MQSNLTCSVTVFLPIHIPPTGEMMYMKRYRRCLRELYNYSKHLYIPVWGQRGTYLKVEPISEEEHKTHFNGCNDNIFFKWMFCKITAKFTWEGVTNDDHKLLVDGLLLLDIPNIIKGEIKLLLIYLNLAKPGFFHTGTGTILYHYKYLNFKKKKKESFSEIGSWIPDALFHLNTFKWPLVQEIDIKQTLLWLNVEIDGVRNIPKSRVQRALNAFSYLFHDHTNDTGESDLFYSLVGIEALFLDGQDNIQNQIDKKTQILLGQRTEFKKIFNQLYSFRSKYIHGALNLPNKYAYLYYDSIEQHSKDSINLTSLAVLILVASLQKLILTNKHELEFELNIKK